MSTNKKTNAPVPAPLNKKTLRKRADALVTSGVSLLEKAEDMDDIQAKLAHLDSAEGKFKEALDIYENHPDALYNLAILKIDRNAVHCNMTNVIEIIQILEKIILLDTSKRGETTGLAHKALATTYLEQYDLIINNQMLTNVQIYDKSKYHMDMAIGILQGTCSDLDEYITEYCSLLQILFNNLIENEYNIYKNKQSFIITIESFHFIYKIFQYIISLLQIALQTMYSNHIDIDIIKLNCEIYIEFNDYFIFFFTKYQFCASIVSNNRQLSYTAVTTYNNNALISIEGQSQRYSADINEILYYAYEILYKQLYININKIICQFLLLLYGTTTDIHTIINNSKDIMVSDGRANNNTAKSQSNINYSECLALIMDMYLASNQLLFLHISCTHSPDGNICWLTGDIENNNIECGTITYNCYIFTLEKYNEGNISNLKWELPPIEYTQQKLTYIFVNENLLHMFRFRLYSFAKELSLYPNIFTESNNSNSNSNILMDIVDYNISFIECLIFVSNHMNSMVNCMDRNVVTEFLISILSDIKQYYIYYNHIIVKVENLCSLNIDHFVSLLQQANDGNDMSMDEGMSNSTNTELLLQSQYILRCISIAIFEILFEMNQLDTCSNCNDFMNISMNVISHNGNMHSNSMIDTTGYLNVNNVLCNACVSGNSDAIYTSYYNLACQYFKLYKCQSESNFIYENVIRCYLIQYILHYMLLYTTSNTTTITHQNQLPIVSNEGIIRYLHIVINGNEYIFLISDVLQALIQDILDDNDFNTISEKRLVYQCILNYSLSLFMCS